MDFEQFDPFSLLSGMAVGIDEKIVSAKELPAEGAKQFSSLSCAAASTSQTFIEDDEDSALLLGSPSLWATCGSACTLIDSCARQLMRLRSKGFDLPWTCKACSFSNRTWLGKCEMCKTASIEFSNALDADRKRIDSEDHSLFVLATKKGACEVEACFALCEAMANELLEVGLAVPYYRRAFRLWPELDSAMRPDGVPVKLAAEVDAAFGACDTRPKGIGACPILGHLREELARSRMPAVRPHEFHERVLESFDIKGVADYIIKNSACRVVVMCGAGMSTSAGIPDFRTPGSGLYDNLQKYKLPKPEAMFSLEYFRESPGAFYELAQELWPGNFTPTTSHYFIRLLHDMGLLLRCYSQNIDGLELQAGLPSEKLVAAHGGFDTAHVIDTNPKVEVSIEELKVAVEKGEEGWQDLRARKGGLVKPGIVFFGEPLSDRFGELHRHDLATCDLLLVLGTSLAVAPFNSLVAKANPDAPRLLINREPVGLCDYTLGGFQFHLQDEGANWRDAFYQGDVDDGIHALAVALGWASRLESLAMASYGGT